MCWYSLPESTELGRVLSMMAPRLYIAPLITLIFVSSCLYRGQIARLKHTMSPLC